jgi:hypothetical protein
MDSMNYSGIGSRRISLFDCLLLKQVSTRLEKNGYTLRSGGAEGSDKAFESGVNRENKVIFRPHHATYEAVQIAKLFHPAWDTLNEYVKKLMGRNCQIILGENLILRFIIHYSKKFTKMAAPQYITMVLKND